VRSGAALRAVHPTARAARPRPGDRRPPGV